MTSVITGAGGGARLYRQAAASRENQQRDEKDVQITAPLVASFQR